MFAKYIPTGGLFPILVKEHSHTRDRNIYLIGSFQFMKGFSRLGACSGRIDMSNLVYVRPDFDAIYYNKVYDSIMPIDKAKIPYSFFNWINDTEYVDWEILEGALTNQDALSLTECVD